jgi:hypothetical protein
LNLDDPLLLLRAEGEVVHRRLLLVSHLRQESAPLLLLRFALFYKISFHFMKLSVLLK